MFESSSSSLSSNSTSKTEGIEYASNSVGSKGCGAEGNAHLCSTVVGSDPLAGVDDGWDVDGNEGRPKRAGAGGRVANAGEGERQRPLACSASSSRSIWLYRSHSYVVRTYGTSYDNTTY